MPQQALFMMNSPFVLSRAERIASLPTIGPSDDASQRIAAIYRTILARPALDAELDIGREFVASAEGGSANVWQQYAQLLLMSNAFLFVD